MKAADYTLRPLEPSDFEDWWEIRSCPKVMRNTLALPYSSRAHARQKLAEQPENFHSIVAEVDGKVVGQSSLQVQRGRRAHVGQVGLMVHDDYTGQGLGSALLSAIIDLGENWLGLKRFELDVYADNEVARHVYEKHGFIVEGTRHAYALRDGLYVDTNLMARVS